MDTFGNDLIQAMTEALAHAKGQGPAIVHGPIAPLMDTTESGSKSLSRSRYNELIRAEKELNALHAGGVDNWEWYYEALKEAGLLSDEEEEE